MTFPTEKDIITSWLNDDEETVVGIYIPTKTFKETESLKQQILSEHNIVQKLKDIEVSIERIIDGLDYGSMKEEVELLKYIQSTLKNLNTKFAGLLS